MTRIDTFHGMVVSKYFSSMIDFINFTLVNTKFKDNMDMFHANPIPLTLKTFKFFSKIETLNLWSEEDESFGNTILIAYKPKVVYDEYNDEDEVNDDNEEPNCGTDDCGDDHVELPQQNNEEVVENETKKINEENDQPNDQNEENNWNDQDEETVQQNIETINCCDVQPDFLSQENGEIVDNQEERTNDESNEDVIEQTTNQNEDENINVEEEIDEIEETKIEYRQTTSQITDATQKVKFFNINVWFNVNYHTTQKEENKMFTFKNVTYESYDRKIFGIAIPECVNSLGESCYTNTKKMTTFVVPQNILAIKYFCFNRCGNLTSFEFPKV
ncbi:hypothetical protein EIN_158150 [Entamoeba invadens IP1]|uniref:Leucine rich repeat containing protein BspA family protein n=1 Tax=Entamoeba invadens IP1 TaxID=370355 RepID=L7FNZ8_ENTIV|nr:hypothetical protein EIN_158150 [Entamoeba invadens IP1]ELP95285.1 hypothetical protein EIN_158150 [Entamoeba invadens IP1]|eukprot:XP_004262056.1 hypothetical protein EIN_158150 [Entamoeba invadens IP1]